MLKKRYMVITVGIISVLLGSFLVNNVILAQTNGSEYDPWIDYNDDGLIDVNDLASMSQAYGSSGDTTKNVTVTNWPIATHHLTAVLTNTTLYANVGPEILSEAKEVFGIGNKTIIFLGGGVSGGVTFNTFDEAGEVDFVAVGGAPGSGRIAVLDSDLKVLASFALPLNSMFTVQNVDKIIIYAEATIPELYSSSGVQHSSYAVHVVASVYWIEQ